MKAWLIHTAHDLGTDGPDYVYGYGEVDAVSAIELVKTPSNYTIDSISQGGTDTHTYQVPSGASELKVTLAWDDYTAAPFVKPALVNNLNLEVVSPGGGVYYPFSLNPANPHLAATTSGANSRDNQEQVIVTNPTPGTWTIRVRGTSVPESPQSYALAYSHQVSLPVCSQAISNGNFAGTGGWVFSGASRVYFDGSWRLRLGGSPSTNHAAYQTVSIPADIDLGANLSFAWYMATDEGSSGHGWDDFYMEVRDTSDSPLAVYELRNDGWPQNIWLSGDNIDLTPFVGQTVRVAFYATNDEALPTTFYVDDVDLQLCTNMVPDLSIVKQIVGDNDFAPGDPIEFSLSISNNGNAIANDVVVSDILSSDILAPAYQVSTSLAATTERGGAPFVWDLPDLSPGASGDITINGTINPALPTDFTFTNLATISTSSPETTVSNNSSRTVVNPQTVFLPVVYK
jgi:uncharacterized repeat protein (TIGR01451 family)